MCALALAGCLGQAPAPALATSGMPAFAPFVPPVPDFDFSTVVDPDHASHSLAMLHAAGHGLREVGHTAIQPALPPTVRGSITQVDVWGTWALVSGMEGGLAFAIVDLADPAAPQVVSWYPAAADGWTARFSDDGQYVFWGCQVLGALGLMGGGTVKGDCEDADRVHPGIAQGGVVVVDVRDKANPVFVDFLPTVGAHNLQAASIQGKDYVFTNALEILRFDRDDGRLSLVAELPGRHDATAARHPATGDWYLFTGAEQLAVYNITDPERPREVFAGGVGDAVGWHEQTPFPAMVDGRWLLALAGETFAAVSSSGRIAGVPDAVSIVDITDPANPALLSAWQPPFQAGLPWLGYAFSAHEMAATPQGQLAVAWYHGGAWVIDLSTRERQAEPVVLAAFQPNLPINTIPSTFVQTAVPLVPFVWGAGWDARGYLLVPDMHTGLYVMEPAWGLHPAVDGGQ